MTLSDVAEARLGARVYGLAAVAMGIAGLLWGDFSAGWIPAPAELPGRMFLAYGAAVLLLAGGLMINVQRFAAWGAIVLTAVFAAGFIFFDLTQLAVHLSQFDYWQSSSEQVALIAGGSIAFASFSELAPETPARLQSVCRVSFGLCLLIFGAAHFVFAAFSATFVPAYLPPGQMFWVYLTGVAQIAAGLAISSGVLALLAARLLTLMYVLFGVLVHVPHILAGPGMHGNWTENAVNLALIGVAWIVADSLAMPVNGAGFASRR
jgi:uncharacterized membrane protein